MSSKTLFTHTKHLFAMALMLSALFMLGSCKEKKIGYVVMDIVTGTDKPLTTNANPNSTIIINGGDFHYIIKVAGKDKETAELTITKMSYIGDTIKKEYQLKKYPATKQTISLNKPANIGGSDINVTATSVVYLDNGEVADCIDCCTIEGCKAICCGSDFCVEYNDAWKSCAKCLAAAALNCRLGGGNVVNPPPVANFLDLYQESAAVSTVKMQQ